MNKIEGIIELLRKENLDGIVVSKEENVTYLSGFSGDSSMLLITPKSRYFLTDFRYTEQAENECPGYVVVKWDQIYKFKTLGDLLEKESVKKLGFEKGNISCFTYDIMKESMGDIELVPVMEAVENLRYTKDEHEISCIKKAAGYADKAFEEILKLVVPGVVERELAAKLEYIIKEKGADDKAFDTLLVSGVKTSLPHGKPDDKRIEKGDFVTFDFGALVKGYRSDMTRTVVVGTPDEKQLKVYETVKEAQKNALKGVKAGVTGKYLDDLARDIIGREGYNDNFGHGLGHGVGLEVHEEPFMRQTCKRELGENCVVTIEPGIYIPGWGGVRIEDTVVVKKDGCTILTNATKDLIIL